jgi:hypothetical protein
LQRASDRTPSQAGPMTPMTRLASRWLFRRLAV